MKRSLVLLNEDEAGKDDAIKAALNVSRPMVEWTRKGFVEGGLDKALNDDRRTSAKRKLDDRVEAHLSSLLLAATRRMVPTNERCACGPDQMVAFGVAESL